MLFTRDLLAAESLCWGFDGRMQKERHRKRGNARRSARKDWTEQQSQKVLEIEKGEMKIGAKQVMAIAIITKSPIPAPTCKVIKACHKRSIGWKHTTYIRIAGYPLMQTASVDWGYPPPCITPPNVAIAVEGRKPLLKAIPICI